ncbi:MAG: hypothetical protein KAJ35_09940, partial [Thermoplasmata archaeon]|nr:hypothetical protein [Thermoplasmata archaeon]
MRRRTGLARAAIAVVLAIALFGPGPMGGSPTPGGDTGSRSTPAPPDLLMVNVNETSCVQVLDNGTVVTGSKGGGIAEWTSTGTLSRVITTTDGLTSNHITSLARLGPDTWAITRTLDPRLLHRDGDTNDWGVGQTVSGATGPLIWLKGGERLLVLDSTGAVFLSDDGSHWVRPELPGEVPEKGWKTAAVDGDTLALANGTEITIVDLLTNSSSNITAPPVKDLDLDGVKLAIASFDFPDVYDLTTQVWLDKSTTKAIARIGSGFVRVEIEHSELNAVTFGGIVVTVNITVPADGDEVTLRGSLPDDLESNVTDMALLDNET